MPAKGNFGEYYLGLDIGTDSVGWAVTDKNYEILRFRGKTLWGIHLFDPGQTAKGRRKQRIARRRLDRRKHRIALLQSLFSEEISKVDFTFFNRIRDNRLIIEDREHKCHDSLFNDPAFKDKDFHKKYPTIYHLRNELMTSPDKPDIRLLYLACHHIIKYRGHFLFSTGDGDIPRFREVYMNAVDAMNDECRTDISGDLYETVRQILHSNDGVKEKKNKLYELIGEPSKSAKAFMDLLAGSSTTIGKLFVDVEEDIKKAKLALDGTDFEEEREKLENILRPEQMDVLNLAKAAYDSAKLEKLIGTHGSLSKSKIAQFEQHKKDLEMLKSILRKNRPVYYEVFKSTSENNYASYVRAHRKNRSEVESCTQSDFCKYLDGILEDVLEDQTFITEGEKMDMRDRIKAGEFMPKQVSKNNSMFPNSLHCSELRKILENASRHYSFLLQKDESGDSVKDKIEKLCTFRIPYYVGPLVPREQSKRAWFVRNEEGEITPWNFERKVNLEASGEKFIEVLTNKCTYLPTEDVIPMNSTLYSRYMLYNEINNIKINKERIQLELKKQMVAELFESDSAENVTQKRLESWLRAKGLCSKENKITLDGADFPIKASLRAELRLRPIIGDVRNNRRLAEDIIRTITIFGGDRSMLKKKLSTDHKGKLSEEQIDSLSRLKFSGWGKFSEKFLTRIRAMVEGEEMCILEALENTNLNLMELLGDEYGFTKEIQKLKEPCIADGRIMYDLMDDLHVSPPVKRGIWRAMSIIKDIVNVTGHPPAKVFVETTREDMDNKKRTSSRKESLLALYKSCKNQERDWIAELKDMGNGRLRSNDLYSYYCQQGKCMYCGNPIDINDLSNNNIYDLDHIYPRSKKMDDSMSNNLVLVHKSCNMEKGDKYPIPEEWQNRMIDFWSYLKDGKFITDEKYKRLTRISELTEDELAGFINRQLVETSQTVKAVIELMKRIFGDNTDVVYVKANAISDFRNGNNGYIRESDDDPGLKFIKCRSVNDYHHAKDAYLNIVVGNAYDVKFTKDYKKVIRDGEPYSLRLERMLASDIERGGMCAWKAGNDGTIKTVSKYMRRNNILFTKFAHVDNGALFKITPQPRPSDNKQDDSFLPLKKELPVNKYGGYTGIEYSYFIVLEYTNGKKRMKKLEGVPTYIAVQKSESKILEYLVSKGYSEPKIVMNKIRKGTTFEIDKFRLFIAGRTDFTCGKQLMLSDPSYAYCKELLKYTSALTENKNTKPESFRALNKESNISLFDELVHKLETSYDTPFLENEKRQLCEARDRFLVSEISSQLKTLDHMLRIFHCNPARADLSDIGCKATGRILISDPIKLGAKIINQSPSGIFETETDLKKI